MHCAQEHRQIFIPHEIADVPTRKHNNIHCQCSYLHRPGDSCIGYAQKQRTAAEPVDFQGNTRLHVRSMGLHGRHKALFLPEKGKRGSRRNGFQTGTGLKAVSGTDRQGYSVGYHFRHRREFQIHPGLRIQDHPQFPAQLYHHRQGLG